MSLALPAVSLTFSGAALAAGGGGVQWAGNRRGEHLRIDPGLGRRQPLPESSCCALASFGLSSERASIRTADQSATAIDIVEAAYDLEVAPEEWLPNLVRSLSALVNGRLGLVGSIICGTSPSGDLLLEQAHIEGPDDLALRYLAVMQELGPAANAELTRAVQGTVVGLSELADRWPEVAAAYRQHLRCEDLLVISGLDPDYQGVVLNVLCAESLTQSRQEREVWSMLQVHIAAGHRVRRGLLGVNEEKDRALGFGEIRAEHTEAILDPTRFRITHATGDAKNSVALERIRDAAVEVDRARGSLRQTDPDQALQVWQGLVRGRWSLVDCFDTDGRRFVVARANAPRLGDPRGLSPRELQVATYAARGESGKMIGYRFGISQAQVSSTLVSAMRKLGVKTQAHLVEKMRAMPTSETKG